MTDAIGDIPRRTAEAQAALEALQEPAERTAGAIEEAFGRAGERLAGSLARAAADGEITLQELARAVLGAVNAAAGAGLGPAITRAVGGLFGGSRADGGPVSAGGAYLVGERGPEVFRPSTGGEIGPATGAPVTVNVTVQGGPEALLRSEAQVAQALARAVTLGARKL
jgi:phage-related minor tail protein